MDAYCPECQQPMVWRGNDQHNSDDQHNRNDRHTSNQQYYCDACRRYFLRLALCPECEQPLQVLRACGAESYLCAGGHGLISRTRVTIRYQPQ
ncbi:zinc ribbon domain-containing protein [Dickeya chrysanthemi]|uniref:zinc ribbon domain-containing protein n=1 Tax=Dickeya chrysanthemi TaxID=556 RepID=UPI000532B994|nr:zinc ribbon domain-containing protein [Dickeya chrysanthemi]